MKELASAEDDIAAERGRGRGHGSGILLLVFGILIAYPLSAGPAIKLAWISGARPGPPPRVVAVLYAPLDLLYQNSPMVKRFYDWYFHDVWKVK